MINFLAYGAIGLGLALAVLAYRLLSKEQERKGSARGPILGAIYVFMGFALVLAAGGLVSEYLKSGASQIGSVRSDLERARTELQDLKTKHQELRARLTTSREVMKSLMDVKEGSLAKLKHHSQNEIGYSLLVQTVQENLESVDKGLRKALEE